MRHDACMPLADAGQTYACWLRLWRFALFDDEVRGLKGNKCEFITWNRMQVLRQHLIYIEATLVHGEATGPVNKPPSAGSNHIRLSHKDYPMKRV